MPTVTVRDILRLALPAGTRVVAGVSGLTHQSTWVAMLRATQPAFAELRGGEIVLLSVAAARTLDPGLTLQTLVRRLSLAPVPVAAVVALGTVTSEDAQVAERARLPLLQLPNDSDLREVEREISRLFGDYEAQQERRAAQLYNLLTQRSLSGDGIRGLLNTLFEYTGQGVACYASNGELRELRAQGSTKIALKTLRPTSDGDSSLPNQQIWVETIGSTEYPAGYLALAGASLDAWDRLAAARGAAALALEFAKEYAVQAAEERLRGDFLSSVLAAGSANEIANLLRRGEELGYNLALPHVALLCQPEDVNQTELERILSNLQSEINRRGVAAPLTRRESTVLCMLPVSDSALPPRELTEVLRERLNHDHPGIALALGRPAAELSEWRRALEEADQALSLGRELFGPERVLAFSDLGVYRLLVLLRDAPELWSFYRETLSKLAAYDQKQGGELFRTLEAYFNHLGNLRATSESLHVHRNTLLYRLERIKQISGFDLNNAEEFFAIWLAVRAHRVLRTMQEV